MAAGGLNAAYGDTAAPLDQVLTPDGMKLLPVLDKGCAGYVPTSSAALDVVEAVEGRSVHGPDVEEDSRGERSAVLHERQHRAPADHPGRQRRADPASSRRSCSPNISAASTRCSQRWIYPGQSHAGVIGPSSTDMTHWINDRFAGGPPPIPYKPTGQNDVETTTCPKA